LGEAPTIASDFQHQEKLDLQESLIEFKEGDIVEANNSVTTTVDSMNQVTKQKHSCRKSFIPMTTYFCSLN
jgi:hypothetical protein